MPDRGLAHPDPRRPRRARALVETIAADNLDLGRPDQVELIFSGRLYLPGGRLLLQGIPPGLEFRKLMVLDPETREVDHRVQVDVFSSWQPWANGEGIWLLRADGSIDAVDWDGGIRSVPRVQLDTTYDWWLAADR